MFRFCVALVVIGLLSPCVAFGQGRIEQIRQDANQPSSSSSSSSPSASSDDSWVPPELGDLAGTAFCLAALAPFYIPHALMNDDISQNAYFPLYPYPSCSAKSSERFPSYLWCGPEPDANTAGGWLNTNWWGARVLAEDGNDFRGMNLRRPASDFRHRLAFRPAKQLELPFREPDKRPARHDHPWGHEPDVPLCPARRNPDVHRPGSSAPHRSARHRLGLQFSLRPRLFPREADRHLHPVRHRHSRIGQRGSFSRYGRRHSRTL